MRIFRYKTGLYHIATETAATLCGLSVAKAKREVHFKTFDEFEPGSICFKCKWSHQALSQGEQRGEGQHGR